MEEGLLGFRSDGREGGVPAPRVEVWEEGPDGALEKLLFPQAPGLGFVKAAAWREPRSGCLHALVA